MHYKVQQYYGSIIIIIIIVTVVSDEMKYSHTFGHDMAGTLLL